ncbi:neuropeptide CCHamide-2 receptor-like [Argonauta hians]
MLLDPRDKLILNSLISLIGLVGFIGNFLVLRSLIVYKNMRNPHHVVIGGLAFASILYILFEIPQTIVNFTSTRWNITDIWCNLTNYMAQCSLIVVAFHLVVLTILNALILTNRPNMIISGKHALVIVIILFIVIFAACIPFAFAYQVNKDTERCTFKPDLDDEFLLLLIITVCYFLPLGLVLVTHVILHYITQRFFVDSIPEDKRKLSQLVLGLVIAYFLCQLPYHVVNIHMLYMLREVNITQEQLIMWIRISSYLLCLAQLSFSISPIVCAKLSKEFGDSFDEIINCTVCTSSGNQRQGSLNASTPLTCSTLIGSENNV